MKIIPKFFAKLKKDSGKTSFSMEPEERSLYMKYLSISFKDNDDIEIVVKKKSKKKSRDLEKYYWCVIVPLFAEHQGMTPAEAHRELLKECGPVDERGNKITTSDPDFTLALHCQYVQVCKDYLIRDVEIENIPEPQRVS